MKNWQGLREDLSVVAPEGMATATNVSFRTQGELRRRPGLAGKINEAGVLVTEWTDPFGAVFLFFNSGSGTITSVKLSDSSETTLASSLNTVSRGCFAKSNGRIYFTNDFDAMRRFERGDATGTTVGIAAPAAAIGTPTSATTGVVTVGTHGMRYRYYDSKSLYVSDPSSQTDITTSAGVTLTFDITASGGGGQIIRSTDSKVDQVIIEITDAGSSTFYRAATVNQTLTGTTVSIADSDLRAGILASRDGDFGHQAPPLCSLIQEHRGRLFGWGSTNYPVTGVTVTTGDTSAARATVTGQTFSSNWAGRLVKLGSDTKAYRVVSVTGVSGLVLSEAYTGTAATKTGAQVFSATPDMLYWSRAGFPESWNPLSFARRVLQNQSDVPAGMASYNDTLYLFGQRTIRALDYATDPATGSLLNMATEMGLWNHRCLVDAGGRLYGWGRSGAWFINGLLPTHISRPVDEAIDGTSSSSAHNFDSSKSEQFHGVYDPRERVITWFYATSSETYPKHGISFDLDRQEWSIRTWKQGIRAGCITTGGTSNPTRALVADENGYSWYLAPETFDGLPTSMTHGVVTVTSGTTTTAKVSESLPTSTGTANLAGVIVTTSSGAERVVASNTADTITISSTFAAAPSVGAELFLGQIDFAFKSKWLTAEALEEKKRPAYCAIKMVPGSSSGKMTFNVFLDYSNSAYTYTKGASDTDLDGVTVTNNSANVTLDNDGGSGDGILYVPLPGEWHRAISVQISSTRPRDTLKILDVDFVYKDRRSAVRVEDE
jgi:hypothetical protein